MDILNQDTLELMLKLCNDNPNYIGTIAFNTEVRLKEFIRELARMTRPAEIPGIRIIKQHYNSGKVEFFNGSVIHLIKASTISRGIKYHLILCDDEVEPMTRCVLNRFLIPYGLSQREDGWFKEFFNKPPEKHTTPDMNEPDTTELDNFLNEFKITP